MSNKTVHEAACHDPNCSCHHDHHGHNHFVDKASSATGLINDSMILSRSWSVSTSAPVTGGAIEERFIKGFLEIGDLLAVDGVILGHLKGTVKVQSGAYITFSVTRQGEIDVTPSTDWNSHDCMTLLKVIVNILSVRKVNLSLEQFFDFSDI